jgi:hypothetical protein
MYAKKTARCMKHEAIFLISTALPPVILKADDTIALFEALGFERKHKTESDSDLTTYTSIRMKDANGFHVDVTEDARVKIHACLKYV